MAEQRAREADIPESFFDNHLEFKANLYPLFEEINHIAREPSDLCKDYFYRCLVEPRMQAVIQRQPFAESAITTTLLNCLEQFKGKLSGLVEECNNNLATTLRQQMQDIDRSFGQQRPYMEALLTRRVQPFVQERRQLREAATVEAVDTAIRNLVWEPLGDVVEEADEAPHQEAHYQHEDEGQRANQPQEDEDFSVEDVRIVSRQPAGVNPQLDTIHFTCVGESSDAKAIEKEADKVTFSNPVTSRCL